MDPPTATGRTTDHAEPDLSRSDLKAIERSTLKLGRDLLEQARQQQPHLLQRRWWDDRIMSWAMRDESLKTQLFRFVDVLPMLQSSQAIADHLHEYLRPYQDRLPAPLRVALGVGRRTRVARQAVARAARLGAMDFARRFIAGTNAGEVMVAVERERKLGRGFTLDILGEAVTSDVEARRYLAAYVELIESIAPTVNAWPESPQIDRGVLGKLPRVNVSVKLSALDSQFDPIDPEGTTRRVAERLRELLRVARRHEAFLNVDMESYETKDLTLRIFTEVLAEDEFRDVGDVGIVIQCYLKDAGTDLRMLRDWAARRGKPVWLRLVKGAYWDYETNYARQNGWPVPVYQRKWESDANFESQSRFLMQNYRHLRPALGTHNIRSLAYGIAVAKHLGLPEGGFEIQMLYGMGDAEKKVLVDSGYRMRVYMPYGQLIPGMAYLVRRLLENTSNDSFLRASFLEDAAPEKLLGSPLASAAGLDGAGPSTRPTEATIMSPTSGEQAPTIGSPSREPDRFAPSFHNEPPVDFARQSARRAMAAALDEVKQSLGRLYPLVIGSEQIEAGERLESLDPSCKRRVVGTVPLADKQRAEAAVARARDALPAWSALGVESRAGYLRRAAQAMRERLFELAAWEVYECAKPWHEATADVCEAIDFCDYYAAAATALQGPHGVDVPGEQNRFEYLPRGVAAVIAPWNFPLAILTGMTVAALVTGNTVVMKPAEQSPVVAAKLMDIFTALELPPGVLNFLPGRGEVAGAALVEHPDVALVAFTGSRSVGLAINAKAAAVSASGATNVKRVIAEMGGKNAIIVDDDADLDDAVLGVVKSAFGYQGQKCSACGRVIVLEAVYNELIRRLVEATRSLKVGPAEDPATTVSAVIDQEALTKIERYIQLGRKEGRQVLAVDVRELAQEGFFVGPHIFADMAPGATLAQEEVFGPVLAVLPAKDLDEAIRIANETDYALTGGIYSRSPANLDRARREFSVGNLYLNRNITGALVGRQPFGGFKMSGIGTKAGGADYLLQFVVPRTVTENTLRRGFAPASPE